MPATPLVLMCHSRIGQVRVCSQARGNHFSQRGQLGQKSPVRHKRGINFVDPNLKF